MPDLIVKHPTDLEIERAAEVATTAFPHLPLEYWQNSFHTIADMYGKQFILVVETDGKIVASMLCTPAPVYVQGKLVPHSAAGGVGTLPEYRKIGAASAMMKECVRTLRREGIAASSLWPFSYPYYRKFGWEIGSEVRAYSVPSSVAAELGNASNARGATPEDFIQITELYDSFAPHYNCLTERSDEWWARIIKIGEYLKWTTELGNGMVVHVTDNEIDGYAAYSVLQKEDRQYVFAREILFSEYEHRQDMLALLATINPEGNVNFDAPLDDVFLQELPDPRVIQAKVEASFQFRVIDPVKAVTSIMTSDYLPCRISFSISDPVFEEGFEFGVEIEGGRITKCDFDPHNALKMDIRTFARLYSGYLDTHTALSMGRITPPAGEIEAIEAIDAAAEIFGHRHPYRSWLEPG